eukprot:323686-Pyramimonas_sp.AAC.1
MHGAPAPRPQAARCVISESAYLLRREIQTHHPFHILERTALRVDDTAPIQRNDAFIFAVPYAA